MLKLYLYTLWGTPEKVRDVPLNDAPKERQKITERLVPRYKIGALRYRDLSSSHSNLPIDGPL
jgi:hypothetical protein